MSKLTVITCLIGIVALTFQARADDLARSESTTKQYRLTLQIGPDREDVQRGRSASETSKLR